MKCKLYKNTSGSISLIFNEPKREYAYNKQLIDFFLSNFDDEHKIKIGILESKEYIYFDLPEYVTEISFMMHNEVETLATLSDNNVLNIVSPNFWTTILEEERKEPRKYVGIKEFAQIKGKSSSTVLKAVKNGSFPTAKLLQNYIWIFDANAPWPKDKRKFRKNSSDDKKEVIKYENQYPIKIERTMTGETVVKIGSQRHKMTAEYVNSLLGAYPSSYGSNIGEIVEGINDDDIVETVGILIRNEPHPSYLAITSSSFFKWLLEETEKAYVPYMSTEEYGAKHGKTKQAVINLIKKGRITDYIVLQPSGSHLIPSNLPWPKDLRKERAKNKLKTVKLEINKDK